MLPGVHRVRIKLASSHAEYWYAWRGGPRILSVKAKTETDLERLIPSHAAAAAAAYRLAVKPTGSEAFVSGLVAKYLSSAEYAKLAPRTRADLSRHLSTVREALGEMPLEALKASGARKALLDWRDTFKATPKTADDRLGSLALVFGWAKKRGDIQTNPLEQWPRLYRVNRADVIWTKPDLVRLLKDADKELRWAVLLAVFTGLRLGDLVRLTWADVGQSGIRLATGKSGGKRVAIIPIDGRTAALLKQIGRRDVGTVLTHSRGKPWTGWGLQTAMQRRKTARGISGLRFHDLRGTAATYFIRQGLPLADVAGIMGWTPDRVSQIARRYVTSEAIAQGMLERLGKNKRGSGL
jgi:integrase